MSASIGLTALNGAVVGSLRIPALMIGCVGVLGLGEIVRRAITHSVGSFEAGKKATAWVYERTPTLARDIFDRIGNEKWQTIARVSAYCFFVHVASCEVLNLAFGSPSVWYNRVLQGTSFIQVVDKPGYHHPLVQKGIDFLSPYFSSARATR